MGQQVQQPKETALPADPLADQIANSLRGVRELREELARLRARVQQLEHEIVLPQPLRDFERAGLRLRLARLELTPEEMPRLWEEDRHGAIVRRFRELGYLYVTLDLQGFRSGSANEALKWIGKK